MNLGMSYFLLAMPAAAGLMLWRRRYLRLATSWQWSIAAIAIALTLLSMAFIVVSE